MVGDRRYLALVVAGSLAAASVPLAAHAETHGALERIFGRVVAVDARSGAVRIDHGALETAARGVEACVLARGERARLRPGEAIEALADTSRRPWRLSDIVVLRPRAQERRPARRSDSVRIAESAPNAPDP